MSIGDAKSFIKRAAHDAKLRGKINAAADKISLSEILSSEGFQFDSTDFENAFNNLHISCQSYEQAAVVKEIKMWWDFTEKGLK